MTHPKLALTLGTGYSGKSYLQGWLLAHLNRPFSVVVHTHVDRSYLAHVDKAQTKFFLVGTPGPVIDAEFLNRVRAKYKYCWFSIGALDDDEIERFIDSLSTALMGSQDAGLFIDEAHHFCAQGLVPRALKRLIRGGRHYGIDVFLASHGLTDIDIKLRKTLQQLFLFKLTEGRDLDNLAGEVRFGIDIANKVAALAPEYFIMVDRRTSQVAEPARI